MSESDSLGHVDGQTDPIAYAYDDTHNELIAELYTDDVLEACEDTSWIRVEEVVE